MGEGGRRFRRGVTRHAKAHWSAHEQVDVAAADKIFSGAMAREVTRRTTARDGYGQRGRRPPQGAAFSGATMVAVETLSAIYLFFGHGGNRDDVLPIFLPVIS